MKITNSTNWDTAHLRRVFSPVLAAWNKRHAVMPRRVVNSKLLRIKVMYSKGFANFHGCAWLNTGSMEIRLPRPVGYGVKHRVLRYEQHQETDAEGKVWYYSKPIPDSWHMVERHVVKVLDVVELAFLFEHELAHCAGYVHKQMAFLNYLSKAKRERYDYVAHLKVEVAQPKAPKPKPDQQVLRYQRAQASIRRWETKAKRAATAIKKYKAVVKRYEAKAAKP